MSSTRHRIRETVLRSRRIAAILVLAVLPTAQAAGQAPPRFVIELEGGPVWQSYNDVEIPNDGSGTRFSLKDLAGSGPWASGRLYVTWNLNERHGIRALVAPLSLSATGVPDRDIRFAGESFQAGESTRARYTFNSYRLTYRYRFHAGRRAAGWVGLTAKVRDAVIALDQGGVSGRKPDLGFVPLLHLAGDWRLGPGARLRLDADALAGGPGRAEDVALELALDLDDRWTVEGGYRLVEGGADVEEVYTFAWLHYAVVSLVLRI